MNLLDDLIRGQRLSREEAADWMSTVIQGEFTPEQLAGVLAILRHRGETDGELLGFLDALYDQCVRLPWRGGTLIDPVGTGGDGLNTVNISTTVAFVLAAAGVPVAKHGNRAASSRSGSSDALEAAGVPITGDTNVLAQALDEIGIAFLFAPYHHPALRRVAPVRRAMGVMTTFNVLGPLANPAPVTHQYLGVARPELLARYASVTHARGIRARVVHGAWGADEALPGGPFTIVDSGAPDALSPRTIDPAALGVAPCTLEALRGGDAAQNAAIMLDCLQGRATAAVEDAVALNAGVALDLAGAAPSIEQGIALARALMRDGEPLRVLRRYSEFVSRA